jgi:phage terminase large subunit GpA-like protein
MADMTLRADEVETENVGLNTQLEALMSQVAELSGVQERVQYVTAMAEEQTSRAEVRLFLSNLYARRASHPCCLSTGG